MKCIICGEDLKLKAGDAPFVNVDTYGRPANAKTECCNSMLRIYPKRSYQFVHILELKNEADDWGRQ